MITVCSFVGFDKLMQRSEKRILFRFFGVLIAVILRSKWQLEARYPSNIIQPCIEENFLRKMTKKPHSFLVFMG
jgi:hypothetical protein